VPQKELGLVQRVSGGRTKNQCTTIGKPSATMVLPQAVVSDSALLARDFAANPWTGVANNRPLIAMRLSQPILVICLVVGAAIAGIAFFAFRSAESHQDVMLDALQRGMERVYDSAITGESGSEPVQSPSVSSRAVRKILSKEPQLLPSFVSPENVFVARRTSAVPSDELVFLIKLESTRFYGITGNRLWRMVTPEELETWPHESLVTNAPAVD